LKLNLALYPKASASSIFEDGVIVHAKRPSYRDTYSVNCRGSRLLESRLPMSLTSDFWTLCRRRFPSQDSLLIPTITLLLHLALDVGTLPWRDLSQNGHHWISFNLSIKSLFALKSCCRGFSTVFLLYIPKEFAWIASPEPYNTVWIEKPVAIGIEDRPR
jgi:hypothetical protein